VHYGENGKYLLYLSGFLILFCKKEGRREDFTAAKKYFLILYHSLIEITSTFLVHSVKWVNFYRIRQNHNSILYKL